jgi:hypothetical protein
VLKKVFSGLPRMGMAYLEFLLIEHRSGEAHENRELGYFAPSLVED